VILSLVFVLPNQFAIDVYGRVGWSSGLAHIETLMAYAYHVHQVGGHAKTGKLAGVVSLTILMESSRDVDRIST